MTVTSGRMAFSSTLEDGAGVPRLCVTHLTWSVETDDELCGEAGPPPMPGALGYLCTRPANGHGTHVAWLGGQRLDSWPAAAERVD